MAYKFHVIVTDDGKISYIRDGKIDRYQLMGILQVEIDLLKKECVDTIAEEMKKQRVVRDG